jgi:uncharacterized protein YdeI (YjbR/CyaY-like superfamily)
MGKSPPRSGPPTRSFRSAEEFRAWLAREHARAAGLPVRLCKKESGVVSISYSEALEQALCFGWIDGQKLPFDRLQTAKRPETKLRRMKLIIEMLARGERFH